ncbi:MAG: flagellar motor protein MotB [Haliea sp.]|nr:flagellar motor protein MotB [Haliea sp.]
MRYYSRQLDLPQASRDRWLVSYADLLTLMFAFFVVMYAIAQASDGDYRVLSNSISSAFSRSQPAGPVPTSVLEGNRGGAPEPSRVQVPFRAPHEHAERSLEQLSKRVMQVRNLQRISLDRLRVEFVDGRLDIDLDATLLFPRGSSAMLAAAMPLMQELGAALGPLPNRIKVAGHTDNIPIRNRQFSSNWELSAARAASVVRTLASYGVAPPRLSLEAFGEQRPKADNSTETGRARNRRVVVSVLAEPRQGSVTPALAEVLLAPAGIQR